MPLATNPKALFEIVLDSDKEYPEGEKPVFIYHYLTGLEEIELTGLLAVKKDVTEPKSKDVIEESFKAAMIGLIDWKNIFDRDGKAISFSPTNLWEIMGFREATELAWKVLNTQILSLDDKKKLESLSESSSAKSAKTAEDQKSVLTK